MSIELDVLFKKMQKDDKKEVIEFHIIDDEVPHATELIQMAGSIAVIQINESDKLSAEFKSVQRDSKKATLKFEVKGDNEDKVIKLYKLAGSNVTLNLEPSQMSIDDFYDADEHDPGLEYNIDSGGVVQVAKGQMAIDDIPAGEPIDVNYDDEDLLN